MPTERRISLRLSPEHFDRLDEKRFRSRLSFQELGLRLLDDWLASENELPRGMHSSLRKPADPLLEKIAMIQARREKGLLALIEKAVNASWAVMQNTLTPEELAHLRAVAYGEAAPLPKGQKEGQPTRRGRPRKIA